MDQAGIAASLRDKIFETIDRTQHLVSLAPAGSLDWRPAASETGFVITDLGHLLGHLPECMAGFCAAFHAAFPDELSQISKLRALGVNHSCTPEEAHDRINLYSSHIAEAFKCCQDADLARLVPTVFVPSGETLALILMGNLEHLLNHKYQLFFYLKLMGIRVGTPDLYQWRNGPEAGNPVHGRAAYGPEV